MKLSFYDHLNFTERTPPAVWPSLKFELSLNWHESNVEIFSPNTWMITIDQENIFACKTRNKKCVCCPSGSWVMSCSNACPLFWSGAARLAPTWPLTSLGEQQQMTRPPGENNMERVTRHVNTHRAHLSPHSLFSIVNTMYTINGTSITGKLDTNYLPII